MIAFTQITFDRGIHTELISSSCGHSDAITQKNIWTPRITVWDHLKCWSGSRVLHTFCHSKNLPPVHRYVSIACGMGYYYGGYLCLPVMLAISWNRISKEFCCIRCGIIFAWAILAFHARADSVKQWDLLQNNWEAKAGTIIHGMQAFSGFYVGRNLLKCSLNT